jgi:hypothetical protein
MHSHELVEGSWLRAEDLLLLNLFAHAESFVQGVYRDLSAQSRED